MIYLIDDNIQRQKSYGWSSTKLSIYGDNLAPIYRYNDLLSIEEATLYKPENTILFHESFLDTSVNNVSSIDIKNALEAKSKKYDAKFVIFGGSINFRSIEDNVSYIPVNILYQNLFYFIENSHDLRYLLYGKKPELEEKLNNELEIALSGIEKEPEAIEGETLFVRPLKNFIKSPFISYDEESIINRVSDELLHKQVIKWCTEKKYDQIFIPLCFGETLSDFNGLRLATHIRCTETINQCSNIFIYSFTNIINAIESEFFNVLKLKNIGIVEYSKKRFSSIASKTNEPLKKIELPAEIGMLQLRNPNVIASNHSIKNELAIAHWINALEMNKASLGKIFEQIEHDIYYKYNITKLTGDEKKYSDSLNINCLENEEVLFVDDDSEKGWNSIIKYLLEEKNQIPTKYLGAGFKKYSTNEIVDCVLDKVNDRTAVVILDLRLNKNDQSQIDVDNMTSIKVIKNIKQFNKGIQIITFTASNKVWTLQKLKKYGVDGFITKDVTNSSNSSISKLIRIIQKSFNRARVLKQQDKFERKLLDLINNNTIKNDKHKFRSIKNFLELAYYLIERSFDQDKYSRVMDYAYLQLFNIVEMYSRHIIKKNSDEIFTDLSNEEKLIIAKISDDRYYTKLKFNKRPYGYRIAKQNTILSRRPDTNFYVTAMLIYIFGFDNSDVLSWNEINKKRNDVAHNSSQYKLNYEDIKEISAFIIYIFDESNINDRNKSKALSLINKDQQLKMLTDQFSKKVQ